MKDVSKEQIIDFFKEKIAEENRMDKSKIDANHEFVTFGLDSISAIYIMGQLEDHLEIELNPLYFWDYPTIEKFSSFIIKVYKEER